MSSSGFSTLSKVLDVEYEEELSKEVVNAIIAEEFGSMSKDDDTKRDISEVVSAVESGIATIENEKAELTNNMYASNIVDTEYLTTGIKQLIVSSKGVLATLERELVLGSSPGMYDVYAKLSGSILAQYRELWKLNEAIAKLVIENKKQNLEEVKVDQNMILSGNDLLDMIDNAQKTNSLNDVVADFTIED